MKLCRLCNAVGMLMETPISTDDISYYLHHVECGVCGVGTKRFPDTGGSRDCSVRAAVEQWQLMNSDADDEPENPVPL